MAEQLECNGAKFYREAAQHSGNPEYQKHIRIFSNELKGIKDSH
jgi:hypothetical protein